MPRSANSLSLLATPFSEGNMRLWERFGAFDYLVEKQIKMGEDGIHACSTSIQGCLTCEEPSRRSGRGLVDQHIYFSQYSLRSSDFGMLFFSFWIYFVKQNLPNNWYNLLTPYKAQMTALTAVPPSVHRVARKQSVSPLPQQVGCDKKEKREKKGTVWHDGSGGGKQLGQRAKEALDRSKVSNA